MIRAAWFQRALTRLQGVTHGTVRRRIRGNWSRVEPMENRVLLSSTSSGGIVSAPSLIDDVDSRANRVILDVRNGSPVGITAQADVESFYVLTDSAGGLFDIDFFTGVITVADYQGIQAAYVDGDSVTIEVEALDVVDPQLTTTQSFAIDISDLPVTVVTDIDTNSNVVLEGAADGTEVGVQAFVSDRTSVTVSSYSLVDSASGRFAIDSQTGVVTVASSSLLNYETATSHTVTVSAAYSNGQSLLSRFTIQVQNVAPEFDTLSGGDADGAANEVTEGAVYGTRVGITALATDVNGPGVTYRLSDSAGGRFAISASTGVVTVARPLSLDYESAAASSSPLEPSYTITVQALDGRGLFATQTFTIDLLNANPSTPTDKDSKSNVVNEGASTGALVGIRANVTDPNGGVISYSLSDDAGGRFQINSTTGVVSVLNGTLLNFETAQSHTITVEASVTDALTGTIDGGTSTQTFTINVRNIAPTAPADSDSAANVVIVGQAAGTPVGITATSTDPSSAASEITYSLRSSLGGRFAIDSTTGVVTSGNPSLFNPAVSSTYTIQVEAFDGFLRTVKTFTVTAPRAVISTPIDTDATTNAVLEGATNGTSVGITASATDPNGYTLTYSLTDSAGGRFAIDSVTGDVTVADETLIDYETKTSHSITVRATNPNLLFAQKVFTISVQNVVPTTPIDTDGTAEVAEGAAKGTYVGVTALATDPNGPSLIYSLTDTAGGRFSINSTTGVVSVDNGSVIDFESGVTSHTITVRASDGRGGVSTANFSITVTDASPSSPSDISSGANVVAEGASTGTTVGVTARATDPNGGTITYSLSDSAGGAFAIDSSTGVVTVADGTLIDYETATSLTITVDAEDAAGNTSSTDFTINVSNVAPSRPTDTDSTTNSVDSGAAAGTTVGITVSSTDLSDTVSVVTYSLLSNPLGAFTIDSSTGVVTVADAGLITVTSSATFSITVQATDGDLFSSASFSITIVPLGLSSPAPVAPSPAPTGLTDVVFSDLQNIL